MDQEHDTPPETMTPPERVRLLLEGIKLTAGDRNKIYGKPATNLRLQFALWTLYKETAGDKHSFAHDAAMQHIFAKIARIAMNVGHRDNYTDLSVYSAIAWECDEESLLPPP